MASSSLVGRLFNRPRTWTMNRWLLFTSTVASRINRPDSIRFRNDQIEVRPDSQYAGIRGDTMAHGLTLLHELLRRQQLDDFVIAARRHRSPLRTTKGRKPEGAQDTIEVVRLFTSDPCH